MLSVRCLSVCNVRALWPNGWTDQDETWHADRPRPWPRCVRWGPSSPQFSAHICCGQMAAWIKMSPGMEIGLGPGDFVLDGDPTPPPQKGGRAPKFSAHVYCDQTAGWMKLVLGMEVGLSPGDFVLDEDQVPFPQKGAEPPPQFSAHFYCGQTAACIKMPLGLRLCVKWGPCSPLPQRGTDPQFSARICCGQMAAWIKICHLVWS